MNPHKITGIYIKKIISAKCRVQQLYRAAAHIPVLLQEETRIHLIILDITDKRVLVGKLDHPIIQNIELLLI